MYRPRDTRMPLDEAQAQGDNGAIAAARRHVRNAGYYEQARLFARLVAGHSGTNGGVGVLLHATARAEKQWPEDRWRALATQLGNTIDLVVPYGSAAEQERALRIASASSRARVPERQPLGDVARMIAGASFVVGVDTGLLHLAAAFGVPLVAIFTASEPGLTGPMGSGPIAVLGSKGVVPPVDEVLAAVARLTA